MILHNQLVTKYHSSGILLDTNVLLLYCIGQYDRGRVGRFKRTEQFTPEDYDLLSRLLLSFRIVATLPHVLAEVNSLSSQLPRALLDDYRSSFRTSIAELTEDYLPSTMAASRKEFLYLGLTDAAIIEATIGKFLVLTDDLSLFSSLSRADVDVLNFTTLRTFVV